MRAAGTPIPISTTVEKIGAHPDRYTPPSYTPPTAHTPPRPGSRDRSRSHSRDRFVNANRQIIRTVSPPPPNNANNPSSSSAFMPPAQPQMPLNRSSYGSQAQGVGSYTPPVERSSNEGGSEPGRAPVRVGPSLSTRPKSMGSFGPLPPAAAAASTLPPNQLINAQNQLINANNHSNGNGNHIRNSKIGTITPPTAGASMAYPPSSSPKNDSSGRQDLGGGRSDIGTVSLGPGGFPSLGGASRQVYGGSSRRAMRSSRGFGSDLLPRVEQASKEPSPYERVKSDAFTAAANTNAGTSTAPVAAFEPTGSSNNLEYLLLKNQI